MKNAPKFFIVFAAVFVAATFFFSSCQKEQVKEEITTVENDELTTSTEEIEKATADKASVIEYLNITKEDNSTFGSYLVFESMEDVYRTTAVLDLVLTTEEKELWETGLGFTSWRQSDLEQTDLSKMYPVQEIASILSPQGFIKVEGILYQDTGAGSKVYQIDEATGTKTIAYAPEEADTRAPCKTSGSDLDNKCVVSCYSSGGCDYFTSSNLYFSAPWWTSYEYVKVYVAQTHTVCGSWNGSGAEGNIKVTYSVHYKNYGTTYNVNATQQRWNDAYHTFTLARGRSLCYYSASATVKTTWQGHSGNLYTSL